MPSLARDREQRENGSVPNPGSSGDFLPHADRDLCSALADFVTAIHQAEDPGELYELYMSLRRYEDRLTTLVNRAGEKLNLLLAR